jgi:hypothetical protein
VSAPLGPARAGSSPNAYGSRARPGGVDARERELLTGMGNCYEACGADFEGTVEMVAGARHREVPEVKATLARLRATYGDDPEYQSLRRRLPETFPL